MSGQESSSFKKEIAICFLVNGCSSVCMMLCNKHLSMVFPFPFVTIFLQNCVVLVFSIAILYSNLLNDHAHYYANKNSGKNVSSANNGESSSNTNIINSISEKSNNNTNNTSGSNNSSNRTINPFLQFRAWHFLYTIPVGLTTSLNLSTSIMALRYSNLPLIVTFRNLTPIATAFFESFWFRSTLPWNAKVGLVFGLLGSFLYTKYDPPRNIAKLTKYKGYTDLDYISTNSSLSDATTAGAEHGYNYNYFFSSVFGLSFVIANFLLSAITVVFEADIIKKLKHDQPPTAVNCLRIGAMAPILALFSSTFEDSVIWGELLFNSSSNVIDNSSFLNIGTISNTILNDERKIILYIIFTGIIATLFGISGLSLSKFGVRPTTNAFANTMYKLLTTFVAIFVFPLDREIPIMAWCGYSLSFLGFMVYTFGDNFEEFMFARFNNSRIFGLNLYEVVFFGFGRNGTKLYDYYDDNNNNKNSVGISSNSEENVFCKNSSGANISKKNDDIILSSNIQKGEAEEEERIHSPTLSPLSSVNMGELSPVYEKTSPLGSNMEKTINSRSSSCHSDSNMRRKNINYRKKDESAIVKDGAEYD